MWVGAIYIVQFVTTEDKDLVTKNVVNARNHKFVTYITRSTTPHSKQPARPVKVLAVQDGHVGGALGQPLTAAPTAGGVLRWGLAKAFTK